MSTIRRLLIWTWRRQQLSVCSDLDLMELWRVSPILELKALSTAQQQNCYRIYRLMPAGGNIKERVRHVWQSGEWQLWSQQQFHHVGSV